MTNTKLEEFIGTTVDGDEISFTSDDVIEITYECDDSYLVNDSAEQDHSWELDLFLDFIEKVGVTEYLFLEGEQIPAYSVTPYFDSATDVNSLSFTDSNPYRNYRELNVCEYIKESVELAGGFESLTDKQKERVSGYVHGYPAQAKTSGATLK